MESTSTTVKTISFNSYTECWVSTIHITVTDGIGIHLVGMNDVATKECLLRVATAIQSRGYHFPGNKVIIKVPRTKFPTLFDLPIAMGILFATGQLSRVDEDHMIYVGELGLNGVTVYAPMARMMVLEAHKQDCRTRICLPTLSAIEVIDMTFDDIYAVPCIGYRVSIWKSDYFHSIIETLRSYNIQV